MNLNTNEIELINKVINYGIKTKYEDVAIDKCKTTDLENIQINLKENKLNDLQIQYLRNLIKFIIYAGDYDNNYKKYLYDVDIITLNNLYKKINNHTSINPIIEVHKYGISRLNEMISKHIDTNTTSRINSNVYETYNSCDKFRRPKLTLFTDILNVKTVKLKKNTYISDFTFITKDNSVIKGFIVDNKFTTTSVLNKKTETALAEEFNKIYSVIV